MMFDNFHGMWNFWIFGMFLMLLIAIYVANDASQFGENGMLWALVVLLMPMMGLLFYLVIRSTWSRQMAKPASGNERMYQAQSVPPRREAVNTVPANNPRNSSGNKSISDSNSDREGSTDTQFCTSCGVRNKGSATYCFSCGEQIQVA